MVRCKGLHAAQQSACVDQAGACCRGRRTGYRGPDGRPHGVRQVCHGPRELLLERAAVVLRLHDPDHCCDNRPDDKDPNDDRNAVVKERGKLATSRTGQPGRARARACSLPHAVQGFSAADARSKHGVCSESKPECALGVRAKRHESPERRQSAGPACGGGPGPENRGQAARTATRRPRARGPRAGSLFRVSAARRSATALDSDWQSR